MFTCRTFFLRVLSQKRHCLSAMSSFFCASSHKKRHCLSAMSSFFLRVLSQKKTLPFGDVSLLGARWDSNPRHSALGRRTLARQEPQAELRMSHKPCIHRCFRNFRFFVCGYFAAIYARTDSVSINLLRFEMNHS